MPYLGLLFFVNVHGTVLLDDLTDKVSGPHIYDSVSMCNGFPVF